MRTGELYAEGRDRIVGMVTGLSPEHAAAPVPTCPDWCVADVLAHLTGICADVLAGNTEGVATDP
jgi:Mycothiol maleylpyruvate isomerase N-terminal domain